MKSQVTLRGPQEKLRRSKIIISFPYATTRRPETASHPTGHMAFIAIYFANNVTEVDGVGVISA